MLATIQKLRDISQSRRNGMPLDPDLARWLAAALEKFLNRGMPTIDAAMGLHAPRGGVFWWLEIAMRERDQTLRALAAYRFLDSSINKQADSIQRLVAHYAASA